MKKFICYFVNNWFEIFKFGLVGVTTFFCNLFLFQFFFSILKVDYRLAVSMAYVLAVFVHFFLHRVFTFGGGERALQSIGKYFLMLGCNYTLTMLIAWIVVEKFYVSPKFVVLFTTGGTMAASFLLMKYFVFKTKGVRS